MRLPDARAPLRFVARALTARQRTVMGSFWGAFGYRSPAQRSLDRFWRYYAENEVVFAAVSETVMAAGIIPFVTERFVGGLWQSRRDPVQERLDAPNDRQDAIQFRERMDTELCVSGNAVIVEWPPRPSELIGALQVLPTRNVYVTISERTGLIERYYYDATKTHGGPAIAILNKPPADAVPFELDRVIHRIYAPDPWAMEWGIGPIAPAVESIEADLNITVYIREFFKRGAVPPHLFISSARMSDEQARQMQRRWQEHVGGVDNAWQIGVLDGTKGEIHRLGLAAGSREIGLQDLRNNLEARILMAMNVPPIVVGAAIGLAEATYSNYSQARMAMHEENTEPMIRKRDSSFTAYFRRRLGTQDIRVRGDFTGVLAVQQRQNERSMQASRELQTGLVMRNEARGLVGYPPDANGDTFYVPLFLMPEPGSVVSMERVRKLAGLLADPVATASVIREQIAVSALTLNVTASEEIVTRVMLEMPPRGDVPKERYALRVLARAHTLLRQHAELGG